MSPAWWRWWWNLVACFVRRFREHGLKDRAAALTYYSALSIFPGLLVLVATLGVIGQSVTRPLADTLGTISPGAVGEILVGAVRALEGSPRAAGILGVFSLATALWSASAYVSAFMRACEAIYHVADTRPGWRALPARLAATVAIGVLLVVCVLIMLFTGRLARDVGEFLGLQDAIVTLWDVARWPVLVVLVSLAVAILYSASPAVRRLGVRRAVPGSLLAVLLWITASVGFALYVATVPTDNRTYGSLGAFIVFLVWLWLSNIAVLLGVEVNAELERRRQVSHAAR